MGDRVLLRPLLYVEIRRIEWAIDYRTYFEEINAKQRKSAEENNYTVYLKGLNVANLHGKY